LQAFIEGKVLKTPYVGGVGPRPPPQKKKIEIQALSKTFCKKSELIIATGVIFLLVK